MKKKFFIFSVMVFEILSTLTLNAQNTSPYWSLAGNNNATSTSKLGTSNNISLRFYTNNVQRMIINSTSGLVGIGTVTPTDQLHISSPSGTNAIRAQVNGSTKFLVSSNGGVGIGGTSTPPSNGLYVSGNTGIGTGSPSRKLHVVGNALFTANVNVSEGGLTVTNTGGDGISGVGSVRGIYGFGTSYGVQGVGSGSFAYGVYGDGFIGVYAQNSLTSGDAVRAYAYGSSAYGINAYSDLSFGIYATTNNAGSYAGYFAGNVITTGSYQNSDRTLKQNITDVGRAMEIINKLHPKTYTYRHDGNYKLMNLPVGMHYGLIAQEVEEILPELVKASSFETGKAAKLQGQQPGQANITTSETINFKALNYTELIPIVVKGMQEMDAQNKILQQENVAIKQELADLRQMLLNLKNSTGANIKGNLGFLEQNNPNPVNGKTIIRYQVPLTISSAEISITNAKGQLIKTISLQDKGAGQVSFNSALLAAGVYNYSLWVEGKQVDTKRLIIAK